MLQKNKKEYLLKVLLCLYLCLTCALGLLGCSSRARSPEAGDSMETDSQESLLVFYTPEAYSVLQDYHQAHPEIKLMGRPLLNGVEEDWLEASIKQYGEPDILLLGEYEFSKMEQWSENDGIADLNKLYIADDTVRSDQYFAGAFEMFEMKGHLLGLPLGMSFEYMTLREENWRMSSLSALDESYTARELLSALMEEAKKPREEGWYIDRGSRSITEWIYQVGGVQKKDGRIVVDEKMFEQVYTYSYLLKCNQEEADEYHREQEAEYDIEKLIFSSGLDHNWLDGKVLIDSWRGAPQVGLVYAKSTNQAQCSQETHVYWVPKMDTKDQYLGRVSLCGAIGAKSAQQQRAYQVLRQMMDMRRQSYVQPTKGLSYCPINQQAAIDLIGDYNTLNGDLYILSTSNQIVYTLERERLNQKEIDDLKNMISRVSGLYLKPGLTLDEEILLDQCAEKGGEDYHLCYEAFVKILNEGYV